MLRKIARSVARHNIEQMDISIFGKYSPREALVKNGRTGKFEYRDVQKSFFARSWRSYVRN